MVFYPLCGGISIRAASLMYACFVWSVLARYFVVRAYIAGFEMVAVLHGLLHGYSRAMFAQVSL